MLLAPSHLICWILDDVDDDYSALWEIVSVCQQRQPTLPARDLYQRVSEVLSALQQHDYVQFYEGVHFNGDEKCITPVLTLDFIVAQAEAWQNLDWSVPQIKLSITDGGRAFFLQHCDLTFFTATT